MKYNNTLSNGFAIMFTRSMRENVHGKEIKKRVTSM